MLIPALPLAALEALGVGSAVAKIPDEGRRDGGVLLSTTTSMVGADQLHCEVARWWPLARTRPINQWWCAADCGLH
jgi:hypothetical protein